ncbi:hypothetical protein BBD42_18450 [Paenibacillus sp. BIHB 4019]|uniref:Permease n=1 Tax=Paenibacillus sp. BIHB 4019 TaxID=1870819 RepID=A0A1B2DKL9_9BACL|nr:AEC family transporter [Paenibacillus sp. BIHB 4019]ANY68236.1 hypothetical protein BBD42_18450 [Paenibacillus sp. BIHB 4019]
MLHSFLLIVYGVFLPISLPVLGGAALKRWRGLETKPLSAIALYLLSPALILETLISAKLSMADIIQTSAFSIINLVALWLVAILASRLLRLSPADQAGLTLVSVFTNCVNYGLPLVLLAFGQLGLAKASVYVISQMILVNTVGVYFAARSHFSVKKAVQSVCKLPALYAVVLAVIIRFTGMIMPAAVAEGLSMLSSAYAPVVLILLGAQMAGARSSNKQADSVLSKPLWTAIAIRLLLSPLIAALLLWLLQVKGMLFAVLLILASMPTAVNAVIMAEQFEASPKLVSRCILWTTLASFIVLPLLIVLVQPS